MKKILCLSIFAALASGCTIIPHTPGVYLQQPVVVGPYPHYHHPQYQPVCRSQTIYDMYGRYVGSRMICQ